ncbi:MAG: hypothetical protein JW943_07445 [Deltaproteobacteria bacterium]|nr:hypothetical protein [Deltaproteobacteria bacterium]
MIDFSAALKEESFQEEEQNQEHLPVIVTGYPSMETVKARFIVYQKAVDGMLVKANSHKVKSEGDAQEAVTMLKQVKDIAKKIDTQRKKIVADPNDFVKSVNGLCKIFTDKMAQIEKVLKAEVSVYQQRVAMEKRRQEEEERKALEEHNRRLKEEAEAMNKKLLQEAESAGLSTENIKPIEAPVILAAKPAREPTVIRSESGAGAHQRSVWKFEIDNPGQVPREYLCPDEDKIKDAVKSGVREIPGIRIYEDFDTVIR